MTEKRCRFMDSDGCRCLRPDGHTGAHDPSYTRWAEAENIRRARYLATLTRPVETR